jgi:CheY-like chemotaxis protein
LPRQALDVEGPAGLLSPNGYEETRTRPVASCMAEPGAAVCPVLGSGSDRETLDNSRPRNKMCSSVADIARPGTERLVPPMTHSLSVLIVEDNPDGADTLAEVLGVYGYGVHVARDGEEALRLAREERPDVVLLDIGLPRMDGCEVAVRLCGTLDRRPLLVAVTGYTHLRDRCRAAGINHYFIKPADPSELDTLLRAHAATLVIGRPSTAPA